MSVLLLFSWKGPVRNFVMHKLLMEYSSYLFVFW